MKKKIIILSLTMLLCISMFYNAYATGGIISDVTASIGDENMNTMASDVLGYVQFIGWGIAIGMILYVGIKYMMASANEKANLKSGTINLIIGALIIGAASTVFTMVVNIVKSAST